MNKPIRKRAFDMFAGNGMMPYARAYTNDAEAWLREELATYARVWSSHSGEMPGHISFTLQGYDFEDVEAYLRAKWIERAEEWPEEIMEAEGER